MKKFIYIFIQFLPLLFCTCQKISTKNYKCEFANEKKITIIGYNSDAMEPFISKDDKYLFFNNLKGATSKDIFYAQKINDTTFQFKGQILGVNTQYVDANPTMDKNNNFYFISTRNLENDNKTIYTGLFKNGTVSNIHQVNGTINIPTLYWINMGVEISANGNMMFVSNAKFSGGANFPNKGNIRFAIKKGDDFDIPDNESYILSNINSTDRIQYAGEVSENGLEIFYSQVKLSKPAVYELLYAKRSSIKDRFGKPIPITEPFRKNKYAVVEAPTLSADGKRLYYHKMQNGVYSIFMLYRK